MGGPDIFKSEEERVAGLQTECGAGDLSVDELRQRATALRQQAARIEVLANATERLAMAKQISNQD